MTCLRRLWSILFCQPVPPTDRSVFFLCILDRLHQGAAKLSPSGVAGGLQTALMKNQLIGQHPSQNRPAGYFPHHLVRPHPEDCVRTQPSKSHVTHELKSVGMLPPPVCHIIPGSSCAAASSTTVVLRSGHARGAPAVALCTRSATADRPLSAVGNSCPVWQAGGRGGS